MRCTAFVVVFGILANSCVQASLRLTRSTLTITSPQATCLWDTPEEHCSTMRYEQGVTVTTPEGYTLTCTTMEVVMANNRPTNVGVKQHDQQTSGIVSMRLQGSIKIVYENTTVTAREACFTPVDNLCLVTGDIIVTHVQHGKHPLTAVMQGNKATINFKRKDIVFSGSEKQAVSTTITLTKSSDPIQGVPG